MNEEDRKLIINIPNGLELPDFINKFTPEENLYMVLVGSYATFTLKNGNIGFEKDPEEHKALRKEFDDVIRMKDVAINAIKNYTEELLDKERDKRCDKVQEQIEKEKYKLNLESIKYQEKIEQLQIKLNEAEVENIKKSEIINHTAKELENEIAVRTQQKELDFIQEINKNKEKENEKVYALQKELAEIKSQMLETERGKNILLQESIQKIMLEVKKQTNKTNERGKDGEAYFYDLARTTFSEYDGFEIIDKSKTPHSGDFHMNFAKFTIIIDSKCFIDTDVPIRDRKKLKFDMTQNSHIKIAWMVSMHRPILKFSKYPFMIEIEDGICVIYINSLMESENPANLLKMAWHTSHIVFDLLNQDDDAVLLNKYKKNDIRIRSIMDKMMRKSKERYATLKQLKDNFDDTERDIKDVLNDELMNIRTSHEELIGKFWKENMEKSEGVKTKTNVLYNAFCECEINKQQGIDLDMFKQIMKSMLNENEIVIGKTKTQHTILNYKIRK